MSNGNATYDAITGAVKRALVDNFNPEWEEICEAAYKGFIEDMRNDLAVELTVDDYDADTDEPVPEPEIGLELVVFDGTATAIKLRRKLSDMLVEVFDMAEGDPSFFDALNRSVARFQQHLIDREED